MPPARAVPGVAELFKPSRAYPPVAALFMRRKTFVCTSVQPHHGLVLGRLIQCCGPSRKNLFLTFLSL
jgi:hypothetical protein